MRALILIMGFSGLAAGSGCCFIHWKYRRCNGRRLGGAIVKFL